MSLSVMVYGFEIDTNNPGRKGAADVTTEDGSDTIIYTCPVIAGYAILNISVCNRAGVSANNVSIAVASSDTPADEEFVEWNTTIVPYGVLERTQLTVNGGDRVIVRWGVAP